MVHLGPAVSRFHQRYHHGSDWRHRVIGEGNRHTDGNRAAWSSETIDCCAQATDVKPRIVSNAPVRLARATGFFTLFLLSTALYIDGIVSGTAGAN